MTDRVEISKTVFGKYKLKYDCQACGERLVSTLREAGNSDSCPMCHTTFVVPGLEDRQRIECEELAEQNRKAEFARQQHEAKRQLAAELAARVKEEKEEARRQEIALARQRLEAEAQSKLSQCPNCNAERLAHQAKCQQCGATTEALPLARRKSTYGVAAAIFLPLIGLLGYSMHRESVLERKLHSCPSDGLFDVDVSFDSLFSSETIVLDFQGADDASARRIDAVHLLMQFASKIDFSATNKLVLARNGVHKFYIMGSDLRSLANSYDGGSVLWAFNHLPENLRTMSGNRAFGQWTGGWLGVLKQQTDDMNEFIRQWTGY